MNTTTEKCKLLDPDLVVAPHGNNSPPSWVGITPGQKVVWIDTGVFGALLKRKNDMPCDICPSEIKNLCKRHLEKYHEDVEDIVADLRKDNLYHAKRSLDYLIGRYR